MKTFGIAVIAALLMMGMPSASATCTTDTSATDLAGVIYITNDSGAPVPVLFDWVYLESNGFNGLQRGGVAWHGNDADGIAFPCSNPDTILY